MTLWPKLSCIFCATSRATMSVPPPAAKPTMILIARAGYVVAAFWANAGDTVSKAAAIIKTGVFGTRASM